MPAQPKGLAGALESPCGIMRTVGVLRDPWTFLILRSSFLGQRTFAEFRDTLGIATDTLTTRLNVLIEHGIFERTPYQVAGQRTRYAYHRTEAGQELLKVLIALQEWGDKYLPSGQPPPFVAARRDSGNRIGISLIDTDGALTTTQESTFIPTSTI